MLAFILLEMGRWVGLVLKPLLCSFINRQLLSSYHFLQYIQLGGIVLPHDGKCRMNGTRAPLDYNDWITLDYPSVGQVAQALRDNGIIPIFAAEARALPAYEVILIVL